MQKIFLLLSIVFTLQAKAQKAYDEVVYKGKWGNFSIRVKYAHGYTEASAISTIHKKTKLVKTYLFNKMDDNKIYFTNPTNKTSFTIKNMDMEDELPKKTTVTIYYNGKQEEFEVGRQGGEKLTNFVLWQMYIPKK